MKRLNKEKAEKLFGLEDVTYKTTKKERDICMRFVKECYKTNKEEYDRRGQTNARNCMKQNFVGKLAEIAVFELLNKQTTKPDFKIYTGAGGRKSFDADLQIDGIEIHVKAHDADSAKRYDNSWVFQKKDNIKSGGFCVLACVNADWSVSIRKVITTDILPELYREMVIKRLSDKRAIYLDDMYPLRTGTCYESYIGIYDEIQEVA